MTRIRKRLAATGAVILAASLVMFSVLPATATESDEPTTTVVESTDAVVESPAPSASAEDNDADETIDAEDSAKDEEVSTDTLDSELNPGPTESTEPIEPTEPTVDAPTEEAPDTTSDPTLTVDEDVVSTDPSSEPTEPNIETPATQPEVVVPSANEIGYDFYPFLSDDNVPTVEFSIWAYDAPDDQVVSAYSGSRFVGSISGSNLGLGYFEPSECGDVEFTIFVNDVLFASKVVGVPCAEGTDPDPIWTPSSTVVLSQLDRDGQSNVLVEYNVAPGEAVESVIIGGVSYGEDAILLEPGTYPYSFTVRNLETDEVKTVEGGTLVIKASEPEPEAPVVTVKDATFEARWDIDTGVVKVVVKVDVPEGAKPAVVAVYYNGDQRLDGSLTVTKSGTYVFEGPAPSGSIEFFVTLDNVSVVSEVVEVPKGEGPTKPTPKPTPDTTPKPTTPPTPNPEPTDEPAVPVPSAPAEPQEPAVSQPQEAQQPTTPQASDGHTVRPGATGDIAGAGSPASTTMGLCLLVVAAAMGIGAVVLRRKAASNS